MSQKEDRAAEDMTEAMEEALQRVKEELQAVSEQIEFKNILYGFLSQVAQMETRIGDLQKDVAAFMTQAGMEEESSPDQ